MHLARLVVRWCTDLEVVCSTCYCTDASSILTVGGEFGVVHEVIINRGDITGQF